MNPHSFHIVYSVEGQGCCSFEYWCGMCYPALAGRGYIVIGENFVEQNHPTACCCCCAKDFVYKTYFDMAPYKVGCCDKLCKSCCGCLGCGQPTYTTEHDTCYCCYCISCMCYYDCCVRPCFGGKVGRSPYRRDSICFLYDTRCCGGVAINGIFTYVKDSKTTAVLHNYPSFCIHRLLIQAIYYRLFCKPKPRHSRREWQPNDDVYLCISAS